MLNLTVLNGLRIPARCPDCGQVNELTYSWLRLYRGFSCTGCRAVVSLDTAELDRTLSHLVCAVQELGEAVCRLCLAPPTAIPAQRDAPAKRSRR